MDAGIVKKINQYAELVKGFLPVDMILLYGSYAKGTQHKDSDIDIAVVVENLEQDFLDVNAHLFSLTRQIDISIGPKLIIRKENRSGFLESILKDAKIIYKA